MYICIKRRPIYYKILYMYIYLCIIYVYIYNYNMHIISLIWAFYGP